MSRNKSNISLAGWLFADLALVLFVIFLPSRISGDDNTREPKNASAPTTQPGGRGVQPEPVELTITIEGDQPSVDEVRIALEDGLRNQEIPEETKFGVVQVLAGIRGEDSTDSRDNAADRAGAVAKILEKIADAESADDGRLRPWLYTLSGSDSGLGYPKFKLRLFPDNE